MTSRKDIKAFIRGMSPGARNIILALLMESYDVKTKPRKPRRKQKTIVERSS